MNKHLLKLKAFHTRYKFIRSLSPRSVVLDIGSGNGTLQRSLREYRPDIEFISIDIADLSHCFPENAFYRVDVTRESLPIDACSVDAVFCSHVVEHLHDCTLLLTEIQRVLKPGGGVYIETPGTRSLFIPGFNLPAEHRNVTFNFYDDPTHIRPYTRQSLRRLCEPLCCTDIKTGFARNWLYCILFPVILIYAIWKRNPRYAAIAVWNLTGWCVYFRGNKK